MIANKLKEIHEKTKLSRKELCDKIFLADDAYYNWAIRGNFPKPHSLCDLALALDVSIDYLLDNDVNDYNRIIGFDRQKNYLCFIPKNDKINELMQKVTSLSEEQQKLILGIINGSKLFDE